MRTIMRNEEGQVSKHQIVEGALSHNREPELPSDGGGVAFQGVRTVEQYHFLCPSEKEKPLLQPLEGWTREGLDWRPRKKVG